MNFTRVLNMPLSRLFGRRVPQRVSTRRPRVGSTICCAQFRMTVPIGFSQALWQWLNSQGWRVMPEADSRYRYRALPSNVVAAMVDAAPEQWEKLLTLAYRRALDQAAYGEAKVPVRA